MDTIKIYAEYMPQFHAYCVKEDIIKEAISLGKVPDIYLKNEDFTALGGKPLNTPLIGFLMGKKAEYYFIGYNYAKSIVTSNVRLKLLTYENTSQQMSGINGLILPDGIFSCPDFLYNDNKEEYHPNSRYEAYETAIIKATQINLPMLGICMGGQIIAGILGGRLYRDVSLYTNILHRSKEQWAHFIRILPHNPLAKLFISKIIKVNSRHIGALNPHIPFGLEIYAISEDGIPEAWGSEEKNILCIQWHPEDFAVEGNKTMQKIYNWLAQKAVKK